MVEQPHPQIPQDPRDHSRKVVVPQKADEADCQCAAREKSRDPDEQGGVARNQSPVDERPRRERYRRDECHLEQHGGGDDNDRARVGAEPGDGAREGTQEGQWQEFLTVGKVARG